MSSEKKPKTVPSQQALRAPFKIEDDFEEQFRRAMPLAELIQKVDVSNLGMEGETMLWAGMNIAEALNRMRQFFRELSHYGQGPEQPATD